MAYMAHNSDDLCWSKKLDPQTAADRIAVSKCALRQRLVNHDDRLAADAVLLLEESPFS